MNTDWVKTYLEKHYKVYHVTNNIFVIMSTDNYKLGPFNASKFIFHASTELGYKKDIIESTCLSWFKEKINILGYE